MRRILFALAVVAVAFGMLAAGSHATASGVLLEFSSLHCPPCQAMQPVLAQLERDGVPIRHVDVDAEPEFAHRYGIRSTPTFVILKDGREVQRLVGRQTAAALNRALASNPSGPLVATGARTVPSETLATPQTRMAPIQQIQNAVPAPAAASVRGEAMPSSSVAAAVQRAQAATVRLRVHDSQGYGAGTGTIIDTHGEEALVLTCGHLFRENRGQGKVEVDLFVGGETKTVLGQVIDYDADARDIALVAIRPGIAVQPVPIVDPQTRVASGTAAFSFGCDRGADPSRRDTRVTAVDKYNQHLGVSNLEIEGAPIDGRSGGGLFDQAGRLIGVCNAADYQEDVGIYAGPGSIFWQLDRANLSELYQGTETSLAADGGPHQPASAVAPVTPLAAADRSVAPDVVAAVDAAAAHGSDAAEELIVIVRQRGNPAASQVLTLADPSDDLLQLLQRQARTASN